MENAVETVKSVSRMDVKGLVSHFDDSEALDLQVFENKYLIVPHLPLTLPF